MTNPGDGMPRIAIILAGDRAGGKSTACAVAAVILTERGLRPCGIICSNERLPDGRPVRVTARDIRTGESRTLASRRVPPGLSGTEPEALPPFVFLSDTFAWADSILRSGAGENAGPVFVDEVGPLELEEKSGYYGFLTWVAPEVNCPLILTVRTSMADRLEIFLAGRLRRGWKIARLALDPKNRDSIPVTIADIVQGGVADFPD